MSVYNGEQYLAQAIESILQQTFTDFEFIIINDGSTDRSLQIIQDYIQIDSRIVLISRENKGLIASLNEGLDLARGKYIARMDADDISLPQRLERQYQVMKQNPEVIVCGSWVNKLIADSSTVPNSHIQVTKFYTNDKAIKAMLIRACCFAHPAVMLCASKLQKYNLAYQTDYLHAEDYALWVRAAKYGEFFNIPEPLLNYRLLATSVTRLADKDEQQRQNVYNKIQENIFKLIEYSYTPEDVALMFSISHKARINKTKIAPAILAKLFTNIINANNKTAFADNMVLKEELGNRWLLCLLIKKDIRFLFSKYLYYGLKGIVMNKLKVR